MPHADADSGSHAPKALVIRTAGTNCDLELERAFAMAGACVEKRHLHHLCDHPDEIDGFDLIGFPGGFSYGDDIASGRIFAMRTRQRLYPALRRAIERGVPMIGVCNGFQVLTQVGLLPGPAKGQPWPESAPPSPSVTVTENASARFEDRWTGVVPEPSSVCVWTRGLDAVPHADETLTLPSAHGEGRLVTRAADTFADLERAGQIALRYADNFNGSEGAVAGICDASGLIFGLMPHPERYLEFNRHPSWTRLPESTRTGDTPGLMMFKNAVAAAVRQPA
jgi:phosphoribosylformylglycinamidine synthase subunit PurQ / glutaminase